MQRDKKCETCSNTIYGGSFCAICENHDMYRTITPKLVTDYTKYSARTTLPITNVIFAPPATIVFWNDGTKTVVKCDNEVYDPEKGLAMAIAKRALGNKGNYFETFKKWVDPYVEKQKKIEIADAKAWYVWVVWDDGTCQRCDRAYKRKCDASRAANRLNKHITWGFRHVASQVPPVKEN